MWQPSFGAAEDRNTVNEAESTDDFQWQPSFGAAEDRNPYSMEEFAAAAGWQPSFGAAEDRNPRPPPSRARTAAVAAVLRGG